MQSHHLFDQGASTLSVTVRTWLIIESTFDDVRNAATMTGIETETRRVSRLVKAGWEANDSHPRVGFGTGGWASFDDILDIRIVGDDLLWIRARIRASVEIRARRIEQADLVRSAYWRRADIESIPLLFDALTRLTSSWGPQTIQRSPR